MTPTLSRKEKESGSFRDDLPEGISASILQELLDLDGWNVVSAEYDESKAALLLAVKETGDMWKEESCPHCHSQEISCYDHLNSRSWRHLNAFGKKAYLDCAIPRGVCHPCRQVYRVTPSWQGKSKHFTRHFEALALRLMKETTVKNVGKILEESDQRLWRILFSYVEGARTELTQAAMHILRQQWRRK